MKKIILSVIMIVLFLGLTISTYAQNVPESQKYGGIFRQALTVGPATPIGYPPEGAPDATYAARPALESLTRNQKGGIIEYLLATEAKLAPDRKSVIIKLRKGVKFHDGSDFNAEVAKWNLDNIIKAKKARGWTSVDIIDDYTIRINITRFTNIVMSDLASSKTLMISKAAVEKNGLDWARWHPVGTGPFEFVEYQRDAKLVFKRNENYWQKGKPYLDGMEAVVIADDTVRKIVFQRGDIHTLAGSGLTAKELKDAGFPFTEEAGGTYILVPDSKNEGSPFADRRVRLAVSYAIDREGLAQAVGFGSLKPAYQIYGGYSDTAIPNLEKREFNQEKARQLLAEAGYPKGFKTTIHTFTRLVQKDWVTAIVNMLSEVGISVTGDFPEAGKYTEYRMKGWDNALMAHGMAAMDSLNWGFNFYFGGIQFPSVKKPDGWNELYEAALQSETFSPPKTQALIKLIHDDVFIIPFMEQIAIQFYQKGVHLPDPDKYRGLSWAHEQTWLEKNLR